MGSRERAARLRRQASQRSATELHESVKAATQAVGNASLEAALTRHFGFAWVRRADGRGRELAGISQELLDAWSGPGSLPDEVLASVYDSVMAIAQDAEQHQQTSPGGEPIAYPVPDLRGLTESEARQMMADGLTAVQAEKHAWTRHDLLRHIAWSTPAHAFTSGDILETLATRALTGEAGINVELVSQPRHSGPPEGRRYRIHRG